MDKTQSSPAFLPYKMGYLTDEMVDKARKELGETEEVRRKALEKLRAHIRSQKNLHCPTDDLTLLSFLRFRKFDMSKATKIVNNYYNLKKSYPQVFSVENYEGVIQSAKNQLINVLPYRDNDGCAILLLKFGNFDVRETSPDLVLHYLACLAIASAADVATQVCGVKVIADTSGMTMRHISVAHPKYLHLLAVAVRNALPLRLKAVHIIINHSAVKVLWNILSYALSEKINKRVRIYDKGGSGLVKYFDPRLLPKEYGGVLDFDNSTFIKDMEARKEEYLEKVRAGYR